ncbi:MAG: STAS domain-containing protein [Candidatus Acidiferrales bacterium]
MEIKARQVGNGTILDLEGALKLGEAEQLFRSQIQELLDAGTTHIAVNLGGVTELDSSGIGALVRTYSALKKVNGKCTFFSAPKRVQMILKMVRLDTVLDVVEDEGAALARM